MRIEFLGYVFSIIYLLCYLDTSGFLSARPLPFLYFVQKNGRENCVNPAGNPVGKSVGDTPLNSAENQAESCSENIIKILQKILQKIQ